MAKNGIKQKRENDKIQIADLASKIKLVVFDFDGVFTDNRVYVMEDGREAVSCSRSDSWGISLLKSTGIETRVISTEVNPVVGQRCNKMQITCIQGCDDKKQALENETASLGVHLNEVAFLGNDTNDLECLKAVGFGACVQDAHPSIKDHVQYVTEHNGGHGAVREFCELFIGQTHG